MDNRKYFISLKIPMEKIEMEEGMQMNLPSSRSAPDLMVFPFILRKENDDFVKVIVIDEMPKGSLMTVYKPKLSAIADKVQVIELTDKSIDDFLKRGFRWHHIDEYTVLW